MAGCYRGVWELSYHWSYIGWMDYTEHLVALGFLCELANRIAALLVLIFLMPTLRGRAKASLD